MKPTDFEIRMFCHTACDDYMHARRAGAILMGARDRHYTFKRPMIRRFKDAWREFWRDDFIAPAKAP